jgi:peptidoglycan/LPS O-acetylase OafA/YrhL
MNYHQPHGWWLAHCWSLGVEEQFYLLWPALLVLCGRRAGLAVCAAYVVAAPLIRVGSWVLLPDPLARAGIGHTFPTAADAIATGCLLAGLGPWLATRAFYRRLLDGRAVWLVLAGTLACIALTARVFRVKLTLGPTLLDAGIAHGIAFCLRTCIAPGSGAG